MKVVDSHVYLGHIIGKNGENSLNIKARVGKSIGSSKSIFLKLDSMYLGRYYFESAKTLMLSILRSGLIYSSETYYDLTEIDLRDLERAEESFLRQLFKQAKGCPISQFYLEMGIYPIRFEIIKSRLLYLQYILKQDENYTLYKFFFLEPNNPTKGCWELQVLKDLKKT